MTYEHLLVDRDGDITTITLNRPEKRNALALDVMIELTETLQEVGATDALGVVLAANGPVFSAGHNFGDMVDASLDDAQRLFEVCTDMMDTVQGIPQPVIARVHALATAAGCQLVATCDLAIAAESAGFAIPGGKKAADYPADEEVELTGKTDPGAAQTCRVVESGAGKVTISCATGEAFAAGDEVVLK